MIYVTRHAIERYQERVDAVSAADVRARIMQHEVVLSIAADFGAPVVKLASGVRFVLKQRRVVTVFGPDMRLGPVGA